MFVPNPYKNSQNLKIHEDITSRKFKREEDIREHLRLRYSEEDIRHYLNFRYQENAKARLSGRRMSRKTQRALHVITGAVLLVLHFTILRHLDPVGYNRNTGTLVVTPVTLAINFIIFYGVLILGLLLLIIAGYTAWKDRGVEK